MYSKTILKYLIAFFIVIGVILIFTQNAINDIRYDNYLKESIKLKEKLNTLINEKSSATNIIAVSLSQNEQIKKSITTNNPNLVDLKEIYKQYNLKTNFKNVWLHIITKDGRSFSRSWVDKKGDYLLNARKDLKLFFEKPEISSYISTGKFDLTFKSTVPIYKDNELLGAFEIITHFNSISKILGYDGIESLFIVDKSYKKQLTKAFTKMFADDYYIANFDAPIKLQNYFKNNKHIINKDNLFYVDKKANRFITVYHLPDVSGNKMAYLIMSKNLDQIKHQNIVTLKIGQMFLIVLGLLMFFVIFLYLKVKKSEKQLIEKNNLLEIQKNKTQRIFDAQPSITVLTNGKAIFDANREFFMFFDKYKNIKDFKKEHNCICEFFEKNEENGYISEAIIDGLTWIEYLLKNNDKTFKVKITKENKEYHFVVVANTSNIIENKDDNIIVVSLVDVTHEVELQNSLREKDQILLHQSKMVSMGEMLENIAHQWRQPLSVISTVSTGIKMKIEFNMFDKNSTIECLDILNKNAQYLSKTIDDFRNFFNTKLDKTCFDLNNLIQTDIDIVNASLKNNNIILIFTKNIQDIRLEGYENKITQVILNIINNAKDALKSKDISEKYIFIKTQMDEKTVKIKITDNAGGIADDIKDKIFEPYFTTKHQSQGTGIGLYMADQIITKHLEGKIEFKNSSYEYKGIDYSGAEFIITLPLI